MPKETKLAEDAIIYQPRRELTEKEKLRDMPPGKRLSYLWEYYRIHAVITVAVIGLASYIIYKIATPDIETQFYAAIIDNTISDEVWAQYKTDFEDYLNLDPATQETQFNSSFYLNSTGDFAMNMQQVLSTYVAASEIDVIIAPKSQFESYAYYGYMDKLSDQLPTNIYSGLTDYVYISSTEEEAEKSVYGVYLTDTKLFRENANNSDPYILGIVVNSKHKNNAIEFIRTLFNK